MENQRKINSLQHKQTMEQLFPFLKIGRPELSLESINYIQSFTTPIQDIESFTNLYNIIFDTMEEICECRDKHIKMQEKLQLLIQYQQL